jgi:hypothetical protein
LVIPDSWATRSISSDLVTVLALDVADGMAKK